MPISRLPLVACLVGAAVAVSALPVSVVDDRCREVTLVETPQRVVALLPFYSEILLELVDAAQIVGVGDSPDTPPVLASVASVGPAFSASREAIVALRPDVVLGATDWDGLRGNLEGAGVPVFTVGCFAGEPDLGAIRDHDDVFAAIRALSTLTSGSAAAGDRLIARLRAELRAVAEAVAEMPRPSVLVLYPDVTGVAPPTSAGALTPERAALEAAGGRSAVDHEGYLAMSAEQVVNADPDYIIADGSHVVALRNDRRLAGLAALRGGKVCVVPASAWNSSRIGETVQLLASILHPDARLPGASGVGAADACRS